MKYRMEFFPEVSYEPDTDKWRLFPESKLNQDWYDQFLERPPLNQVPVYLSLKDDLPRLFRLTLNDELSQWEDGADYFRGKTEAVLDVALRLLNNGWEIYYISDY